jgi:hypothetical protein
MTPQEITRAIISGQFSNDELNTIADAIKFARGQLVKTNKGSMVIGTPVKFTNNRTGQTVVCPVQKVNRKFIIVSENRNLGSMFSTQWRVPASMLSLA